MAPFSVNVEQIKVEGPRLDSIPGHDTGIGSLCQTKGKLVSRVCSGGCLDCPQVCGTGLGLAINSPVRSVDEGADQTSRASLDKRHLYGAAAYSRSLSRQLNTQSESADKVRRHHPKPKPACETILVIDDDPSVRDLMSRFS